MTDEEYVKRSVELAEGWELTCDVFNTYVGIGRWKHILPGIPQVALDVLAAQLVRQVSRTHEIYIGPESIEIRRHIGTYCDEARVYSGDRTLNTLKAIVDSGVLE